ncbi:MAG: ATP synthase F1 subunit epsilon [Candidatus Levyibacteriota bacterium]
MKLDIVSPEKTLYSGDVEQITIDTVDGRIAILPHHVNLFTKVKTGELKLKVSGKEELLAITGGFLQVSNNTVTILADYAIHAEDIDVQKAVEAQKRAEELLKKKEGQLSDAEYAELQSALGRAILELRIADRRKRRIN